MSKAPRNTDQAATKPEKPATKRRPGKNQSRLIKDPVLRSDTYTANVAGRGAKVAEGKMRMARLHELFGEKSEAMMQVMADIAEDKAVHPSVRLEAADKFLNRLLGKPKEHIEVSDPADAAGSQDEVMALLSNIFDAVGLPPLIEGPKGSPTSES